MADELAISVISSTLEEFKNDPAAPLWRGAQYVRITDTQDGEKAVIRRLPLDARIIAEGMDRARDIVARRGGGTLRLELMGRREDANGELTGISRLKSTTIEDVFGLDTRPEQPSVDSAVVTLINSVLEDKRETVKAFASMLASSQKESRDLHNQLLSVLRDVATVQVTAAQDTAKARYDAMLAQASVGGKTEWTDILNTGLEKVSDLAGMAIAARMESGGGGGGEPAQPDDLEAIDAILGDPTRFKAVLAARKPQFAAAYMALPDDQDEG